MYAQFNPMYGGVNAGFGMSGMGQQQPMMMMMMMLMQMMGQMLGQMMGGGQGFPGMGFPGMGGPGGCDPFGGFGNQIGNGFGFPGGGCGCCPQVPFGGGYAPPAPGYGGAPSFGGTPYFGGPSPSFGGNPAAPMVGPGQFGGASAFGNRLAADAQQIAASGVAGRGGNCKRGVRMALNRQGVQLDGLSAYQGADQLARNPRFREVRVSRDGLRSLPPGAVVVWDRKAGHPHGHISIALGNGREASDVIRNQITGYGSAFRVFLPR